MLNEVYREMPELKAIVYGLRTLLCEMFHPRVIFSQKAQCSQNSWCSFHISS